MRVVTFKIDEELLEKVDLFARNRGKTRSEVIRRALEYYLTSQERPQYIQSRRLRVYY